jgi:coniferyl-aldehyde dehydrogenase
MPSIVLPPASAAAPTATSALPSRDTAEALTALLERQRQARAGQPIPGLAERRLRLQALRRFVTMHDAAICTAISADYGHRSTHETRLTEIVPVLGGIDHTLSHLRRWAAPQRRHVDWLTFPGAHNRIIPQPLGVVGVIVPWNFPLNLSLLPLAAILGAGNSALIKMSEHSRHLAQLMSQRLPDFLPTEVVQVIDDSGGVGPLFSQLPLDHLLFTGSAATGRAVMASAAANLCPVTLELGGRSPAIVGRSFPLRTAAERILYVKCLNAGQICTTVDHAWLPRESVGSFVDMARQIVPVRYPKLSSPDYTSIHSDADFQRLLRTLEDAKARGATVIALLPGPASDAATRKLAPHLVLDAPADCTLMQREIFGPILPVCGYQQLSEVVQAVNAGPRPLAIYPFSHDRTEVQHLLDHVMSGGVSVNDALFHVAQHDLPFGGVGASGMGHYHGREGFETFSKLRPVFYQARWSAAAALLTPPYGQLIDRALKFLMR